MVGKTEVPRWSGQDFNIWKNEIERWVQNDTSTEETKHVTLLESFRKHDIFRTYTLTLVAVKTTEVRTVKCILDVMEEKYFST